MKLNRVMLAWKVTIRKKKVRRLQFTIGSHEHYRRVLREAFHGLRHAALLQREFRERVDRVISVSEMRAISEAFERLQMESLRAQRLEQRCGEATNEFLVVKLRRKVFAALKDYREMRHRQVLNKI